MKSHLRPVLATALVAGLAVTSLAACGSKSSSSTTAAASATSAASGDTTAAAQQYLDIVGPANDAIRAQVTKIQALPASATAAQLQAITDPWAEAIEQTCDALEKAEWPAAAQEDMKLLIAAWRVAAKQVRSGPTTDKMGWSAWATTVQDASVSASQIAARVRADLGLQPTEAATASTASN